MAGIGGAQTIGHPRYWIPPIMVEPADKAGSAAASSSRGVPESRTRGPASLPRWCYRESGAGKSVIWPAAIEAEPGRALGRRSIPS
jgi:hypothetical protein